MIRHVASRIVKTTAINRMDAEHIANVRTSPSLSDRLSSRGPFSAAAACGKSILCFARFVSRLLSSHSKDENSS